VPKVYRVTLSDEQQEELYRRIRDPKTKPRVRERLEMLRLSNAGLTVPQISRIVRQSEQRVRFWIKRFLALVSFAALEDEPHEGKSSSLTREHMAALREEIEKAERTWSAPQLTEWLEKECGLHLTPGQVRRRLKQEGIAWKRTSRSLRHKQKPEEVAERRADLETLRHWRWGGRRLDRSVSP